MYLSPHAPASYELMALRTPCEPLHLHFLLWWDRFLAEEGYLWEGTGQVQSTEALRPHHWYPLQQEWKEAGWEIKAG